MARSPGTAPVNQINQGTIYTFSLTPTPKRGPVFFSFPWGCFCFFLFFFFFPLLRAQVKPFQWQSGEDASGWSLCMGTSTPQEPQLQGTELRVSQHSLNIGVGAAWNTPLTRLLPALHQCLANLILEGEGFGQKEDLTNSLPPHLRWHVITEWAQEPIPGLLHLGEPLSPGALTPEVQAKVPIAEQRDLREKKNGKKGCLKRPFFCS